MIWSGGMAWIADFPDPSNFYGPILGCGGRRAGWLELVLVLQRGAGPEGGRGRRHGRSGEDRASGWRCGTTSSSTIMDDAPWAPVFNEQRFTMKSDRLGGPDAIFVDPVHIPVHYDEVYAKDAQ